MKMKLSILYLSMWLVSSFDFGSARAEDAKGMSGVPLVLGVEWRAMALASHLGHGPGAHVGVSLFRRHLTIGLTAFARPGPINPYTFEVTPADEQTYRGKSTLALRSDGAFVGLYLAPVFRIGKRLHLEFPVAFGQAAFGFYLTGDDRKTPDGRRVREWEDELLDGGDSSVSLGLEGGARVAVEIRPWLRPYLAAHYLHTFGFDTYVKDSYSGPTFALGLQLTTEGYHTASSTSLDLHKAHATGSAAHLGAPAGPPQQ